MIILVWLFITILTPLLLKYQLVAIYSSLGHWKYIMCTGIVGESEESGGTTNHYIWTHKKFDIGYNGQQIVDVNLTSENKVRLDVNVKIPFTYEVNWHKSSIKYEDRFDKYLDPNFFQHRVSEPVMSH
jgi:hypothetical protein